MWSRVELEAIAMSDGKFRIIHGVRIDCLKVGETRKSRPLWIETFRLGQNEKFHLVNNKQTLQLNTTYKCRNVGNGDQKFHVFMAMHKYMRL